jgi:hypothetical protein
MQKNRPALFRGRHFQDHVIVLCVRWLILPRVDDLAMSRHRQGYDLYAVLRFLETKVTDPVSHVSVRSEVVVLQLERPVRMIKWLSEHGAGSLVEAREGHSNGIFAVIVAPLQDRA